MANTTRVEYHHGSAFVETNEALAHHQPTTSEQTLAIVKTMPAAVVLTSPFHNRLNISLTFRIGWITVSFARTLAHCLCTSEHRRLGARKGAPSQLSVVTEEF